MRKRAALLSACACLICLILFATVCVRSARNSMTQSATENLLRLCRVSASYLDDAALVESTDSLKAMARNAKVSLSYTTPDGQELYASTRHTSSTTGDVDLARQNGSGTALEEKTIYAACLTDGGGVLRMWTARPTASEAMGDRVFSLALIGVLQLMCCYWIVRIMLNSSDILVDDVVGLLTSYAEGRFDARVDEAHRRDVWRIRMLNEKAARIEDQMQRTNRRNQALSAVLNQMENGILAVDDQLNIILLTPSAKRLLSIVGSHEGMHVSVACKDVNLETFLRDAMDHEGVYTNELAVRDGSIGRAHRPIRLYISAMRQDNRTVGAVALIEDISQLRRLEQVRTDFAANVSHELKTPLTSIKGFVETLQAGAIRNPEMADKFLRIIMLEADRLTRLINDILSITKLESGEVEGSSERIAYDRMVSDVVEMLSIHASEKQIALHMQPCSEPLFVWGNADRVEQMLINLVENGIKYNRPGGSVTVSVFRSSDSAQLLVSDTGIGIAEEHLPRLFERFYRVDKGRSRSMGGTGLGLAIVKHIINNMGGMIEVHSKLGEGTEFLVTLPLYLQPDVAEEHDVEEDTHEV